MQHDQDIRDAFTAQARSFDVAGVANQDDVLTEIIALAEPESGQRWLEAACGPGIISRRLAPLMAEIEGIDLTPAMVQQARAAATEAGVSNTSFTVGDVTALDRPDNRYDGAVTRFSVHHLADPHQMFAELARVVRPGGRIVVVDHLADDDADATIWSQSIERLRDPSHWSCRTASGMRRLGSDADLDLTHELIHPVELDFADWLERGGVDEQSREQIDQLLAHRPDRAEAFIVRHGPAGSTLRLKMWFGVFVRRSK